MTRKGRRLLLIFVAMLLLAGAVALALLALRDNIVFFYTPAEVASKAHAGQHLRVGGLVQEGSLVREQNQHLKFIIADPTSPLTVIYQGALPDLFREGAGIVAEGRLLENGVFEASLILAKHDERYMPADVAAKLKEKGEWKMGTKP